MKLKILICLVWAFTAAGNASGSFARTILRHQDVDGLWRNSNGMEDAAALLAIHVLENSGETRCADGAAYARAALLTATRREDDLFAAMGRTLSAVPPAWEELEDYRANSGGWCFEKNSFPDVLSTAWSLIFAGLSGNPPFEGIGEDLKFLLGNGNGSLAAGMEGGGRLLLFTDYALALHYSGFKELYPPLWKEKLLEKLNSVPENHYVLEAAVKTHIFSLLGDWEAACQHREWLLNAQLSDGSWSELPEQGNFELLVTSLAATALSCFELRQSSLYADLDLPVDSVDFSLTDGQLAFRGIVFNKGNITADSFDVSFSAVDDSGNRTELGKSTVEYVHQGSSERISITALLPEDCRALLIEADREGKVTDHDRSNNVLLLSLDDTFRYLGLSPVYAAGNIMGEPLFLGNGAGVTLEAELFAAAETSPLSYEWYDNETLFSSGAVSAEGSSRIRTDWFPGAGEHEVKLVVTGSEASAETIGVCTVVFDSVFVQTGRIVSGVHEIKSKFGPGEYVTIFTSSSYNNTEAEVMISSEDGTLLETAIAVPGMNDVYQWHTWNNAPGEYTAHAVFFAGGGKAVLGEAESQFTIEPRCILSELNLGLSELWLLEDEVTEVELSCTWRHLANIVKTLHFSWELRNPDNEVVQSDANFDTLTVEPAEVNKYHTFGKILELCAPTAGEYQLKMIIDGGACEAVLPVTVIPKPEITLENYVIPLEIEPGAQVVTTHIRLSGHQHGIKGSPAVFSVRNEPIYVMDKANEIVNIKLEDIRDKYGEIVEFASVLAVVKYGKILGKIDLSPERKEGSAVLADVKDGVAEFQYMPSGKSLKTGDFATIMISIHRHGGKTALLSPKIGSVELVLYGEGSVLP